MKKVGISLDLRRGQQQWKKKRTSGQVFPPAGDQCPFYSALPWFCHGFVLELILGQTQIQVFPPAGDCLMSILLCTALYLGDSRVYCSRVYCIVGGQKSILKQIILQQIILNCLGTADYIEAESIALLGDNRVYCSRVY